MMIIEYVVSLHMVAVCLCRSSCCHLTDGHTSGLRHHCWRGRVHVEETTKSHIANVSDTHSVAGLTAVALL